MLLFDMDYSRSLYYNEVASRYFPLIGVTHPSQNIALTCTCVFKAILIKPSQSRDTSIKCQVRLSAEPSRETRFPCRITPTLHPRLQNAVNNILKSRLAQELYTSIDQD